METLLDYFQLSLYSHLMEKDTATKIFEALSSGVRLDVFRLLVRMANEGMVAVTLPPPSTSRPPIFPFT